MAPNVKNEPNGTVPNGTKNSKTMKTKKEKEEKKPAQTREQKILEASRKSSRTVSSARAFLISAGIITEDGELSPIYK